MANIPKPKTHKNVAKNQHYVPRCYMKAWAHPSKNEDKIWIFEKSVLDRPEKNDWKLEPTSTDKIMYKRGMYDIKADSIYISDEALDEIYRPLLEYNISFSNIKLNTLELLRKYYPEFAQWTIADVDGTPFTRAKRNELKHYLNVSRWPDIEVNWGRFYEDKWWRFIQSIELKVNFTCIQNNSSQSTPDITQDEMHLLMKYCLIYSWRSQKGNEIFNEVYDLVFMLMESPNMQLSSECDIRKAKNLIYDPMKKAILLKEYVSLFNHGHKSNHGKSKIETMTEQYVERMKPVFLLTDATNPFITSDAPTFMIDNNYGTKDLLFVATPTLLIKYLSKNIDCANANKLSANEVLYYNRLIAKHGDTLIIKDENYDVRGLFV